MRNNLFWTLAVGLALFHAGEAAAAGVGESEETVAVAQAANSSDELTANQSPGAQDDNSWQFEMTAYVWASGISGDVELVRDETVDVDTSFFDILSVLKFALMGAAEARKGRFVLLSDLVLLKVSEKESGPAGFVDAKVDSTTLLTNFAAGYRAIDQDSLDLDVFAGGQFALLDVGLDLSGPLQSVERDKSKSSIGPLIGTRLRVPLGGHWGLALYGDAAGLGLTSHHSWQLMGNVQYDLSDHWRLAAGYRHVSVKADNGEFKVDLAISGPIFGATYRF